jgi:hypothetical protein
MNNFTTKLEEARVKLPLKRLMEQHGKAPANGNWKSFAQCPYCQHKDSAGVFTGDRDVDLFKCHHTSCPTDGKAFDEVGFLQYELKQHDRKAAAIALMKKAGVWKEQDNCLLSAPPAQDSAAAGNSSLKENETGEEKPPDSMTSFHNGDGGGTTAPPGSSESTDDEPSVLEPLTALRWFYERLTLNEKDRRDLWEKRGLTDLTISALGYRSNPTRSCLVSCFETFLFFGRIVLNKKNPTVPLEKSISSFHWHSLGLRMPDVEEFTLADTGKFSQDSPRF